MSCGARALAVPRARFWRSARINDTSCIAIVAAGVTSAKNAWAVGFYVSGGLAQVLILHWNGKAWHRQL